MIDISEIKEIPELSAILEFIEPNKKLHRMFWQCFANTLETTASIEGDGSTYIITGDIPAMWLRDSSAQVNHYLEFAEYDQTIRSVIEGLIKRQIEYILIDPYANAFNRSPDGSGHAEDITKMDPWIWERKYETDSLCYPMRLAYLYWRKTGNANIFDERFRKAISAIINVWKTEQNHRSLSEYRFERKNNNGDTLEDGGLGRSVGYTGMTWTGFRPSDDACLYGYLVPSNMFASVILGYIETIASEIFKDGEVSQTAKDLRTDIETGIEKFGTYLHQDHGRIYMYETDGYGSINLMDDANVPSLLSIPYIGYRSGTDQIYINTRKFILSSSNPYYFSGKRATGVGSPHTPEGHIWPISLIMQGLTSDDRNEIKNLFSTLLRTDDETGFIHESFDCNDPGIYTRPWFAWANSLFAEFVIRIYRNFPEILLSEVLV